jgi:DNA-binding beta-propeller fold protein YncE
MRNSPDRRTSIYLTRLREAIACISMTSMLLSGCGGGSGGDADPDPMQGDPSALTDADPAANQVLESAVPGATVGLTLSVASGGDIPRFSLRDNAGGAFAIDSVTGVVSLAAGVDFEAAATRSITVQAEVGQSPKRRQYTRAFQVSILDSPAPSLQLTFPFAHARFGDTALSVSGIVSHPELSNIRVTASAGGAIVQGEIIGGTFRVRDVPIVGDGSFTLNVVASHAGGESVTQSMTLSREPELSDVSRMVLDVPRARVLMVDRYSASIVASPLGGGARSIVSGRQVGSGPAFVEPIALCLDSDGQTLYVADASPGAVFRVDLQTGNRTRLEGSGPAFFSPIEMDFDPVRRNVLLSDESTGILSIAAATGERRLVSTNQNAGPSIYAFRSLSFDATGDRILVSDGSSVFAVNPVSGAHQMIADAMQDPMSRFFFGMTLGPQPNVAFAADEFNNGVARIDLVTGAVQPVTSSGLSIFNIPPLGSGLDLQYPNDVVVSPDNRLFLIEGEYADPLVEVKSNGDRVVVRNAALGTGVNFRGPHGIKFDPVRKKLLAADNVADFIAEIDPTTGDRTTLAGRSDGKGSIDTDLMDAAAGAAGQFYYVDFQTDALYSVRAGESPQVVSDAVTGSGPLLNAPGGVEIDAAANKAYVIDEDEVQEIDLTTGARRILASGFISLVGMTADLSTRSLYVVEGSGGIFSIDLSTGNRSQISFGSSSIWSGDIAYDDVAHDLLAVRVEPARLDRIQANGAPVAVVTPVPNCGPTLKSPRGVAVDSVRQVAYVTDDAYDAVIAVDLRTGCRQLIAK